VAGRDKPNLLAAIQHAATKGPRSVAWLLTDTLRGCFWLRSNDEFIGIPTGRRGYSSLSWVRAMSG
jgi:hypothetical protein